MPGDRRRARHAAEVAEALLRARYRLCPEEVVSAAVRRIAERIWSPKIALGEAVDRAVASCARHRFTDYERLMRDNGLEREEALQAVSAEAAAIVSGWRGC